MSKAHAVFPVLGVFVAELFELYQFSASDSVFGLLSTKDLYCLWQNVPTFFV